ncbi:MAG: GNAT family N-acetyltransferase [Peptococcaceae bacterium]|nr:GNAT family N-acetyltransferase [Peptococcaceae bacterium]
MATIRVARLADAEALLTIYAPYVRETAISFEYEVPSVAEFSARMTRIMAHYPYLVAEENGTILGYAYAAPFIQRAAYDWSAEATIYLDRDARHQGLGRKLYTALEALLRAQGLCNLCACIAVPTAADDPYVSRNSIDFHLHMGYRFVGQFENSGYKFDRWYHMAWVEKSLQPAQTPAPYIVPFPQLTKDILARCGVKNPIT